MKILPTILASATMILALAASRPAAAHWNDNGQHWRRHHHHHHHNRHHQWSGHQHRYGSGYVLPPRVVYVPQPYYYGGYGNW